jgi:hypothetical protein
VEYELLERESVTVGHKAWVARFGDRPRFSTSSYGSANANSSSSYGSSNMASTSTTGPIPLNKTNTARLTQSARGTHASPLRQEVVEDEERENGSVGRAF